MKIWKNLLEPHIPDLHTFSIHLSKVARFSYLFNLLLWIGQICILFQSPCQNLPDCHTFSISSKFGRLALVNLAKFKKFHNLILKCLIPLKPERAAEARRAVVASFNHNKADFFQEFAKNFVMNLKAWPWPTNATRYKAKAPWKAEFQSPNVWIVSRIESPSTIIRSTTTNFLHS